MMKTFILVVSLLLFGINGCTEHSEPVTPQQESRTLLFTSFETGGSAFIDNWISPGPPNVKFANITPPNGGNFSIFLKSKEKGAYVHTAIPALEGTHNYRLTFWAKSTEDAGSLRIYLKQDGERVNIKGSFINEKDWTHFTIEAEYTAFPGDSIEIMLIGSRYVIPQGLNYFDLIMLEYLD